MKTSLKETENKYRKEHLEPKEKNQQENDE
jgi:hypothetical protein